MNIFILDTCPYIAAQYLCDKHIPKMLLESAQMLSTVARIKCSEADCKEAGLYKPTHAKHPCVLWLLENPNNVCWLWLHACELDREYKRRFNKRHKSYSVVEKAVVCLVGHHYDRHESQHTPFAQCMPTEYRILNDPVTAYRNYYIAEKSYFAKWERGTPQPEWFKPICQT